MLEMKYYKSCETVNGKEIKHPLTSVWTNINMRCYNPKNPRYMDYGGRGIIVCEEWRSPHGRNAFFNWAYDNYPELDILREMNGYQIDRIDNDGPYSPENCRWVATAKNARNKRNTITVKWIDGQDYLLIDLYEKYGHPDVQHSTVWQRYFLMGWGIEQSLTMPPNKKTRYAYRGQEYTLKELVKKYGKAAYGTILARISAGWEIEDALFLPKGAINPKRVFDKEGI